MQNETKIFSVTDLTRLIKTHLEDLFFSISVVGEVSNCKYHSSGHLYFTLKDENASISCVMWKSKVQNIGFKIYDGLKITAHGKISVYEPRGSYQIDCTKISQHGIGELQIKFEELKQKLFSEGLFDEKNKKEIPKYPETIGIITSPTGAAIRDILNVLNRRMPFCEKILFPVSVQGEIAKDEIIKAIEYFNFKKNVDVIILARGGGSIEDLWSFNEEIVAREIFKSKIPIISGVGHEVDFTIADFVSDLRAPTPSAAAELVGPDKNELIENIRNLLYNSKKSIENLIEFEFKNLNSIKKSYAFSLPTQLINSFNQKNDDLVSRMNYSISNLIINKKNNFNHLKKEISNLKIENILKRGFSIVKHNSAVVSDSKNLNLNDDVKITFYSGSAEAIIKSKK